MAMTRWDPFRELSSIQNELDRLFGRAFGPDTGDIDETGWLPSVDVAEEQGRFLVTAELAGLDPKDVDISVENSVLTISGERRFYDETKEESFVRVERRFGRFQRSITLPSSADPDRIDASFDKGVLRIEIPKREEAKPRKIEVRAKAPAERKGKGSA